MLLFKNTLTEDLPKIIEISINNKTFICHAGMKKHLDILANPTKKHLSIFQESDQTLVGYILLNGLNNPNKSLELSQIAIDAKGKGYGRQAIQWIKKFCFEELKFHRLWLDVFTFNDRAIHLYESEGFKRDGLLRDVLYRAEKWQSLYLYSMLEEEYFG